MIDLIPALLLFLLPLAYSPGPGNLFFAGLGAQGGLRAALPALAGYHLATWIVTLAIGLGLLGLSGSGAWVGQAMRLAGAGYILWLATRFLRAGAMRGTRTSTQSATLRDGALLLALNPKAYVIIGLMFSGFLTGGLAETVVITTVFTLNNLVAFAIWALAGDLLTRAFRSDVAARRINAVFGAMLIVVAVWMVWP